MNNKKDPFGFKDTTRIEVIELPTRERGQRDDFISKIQNAKERMDEIAAHLDEHLGFAPDEMTIDAIGIAEALLNKLDDALTIAEQTDDLNQALHQADKDNPARG